VSQGSCKICSGQYADQINNMIQAGKNEGQIKRAIREIDPAIWWSRPTFYAHKEHITHPLVTAADAARKNPLIVPSTNRGALEMIRDAGMRQIIDNKVVLTPDHTLKAISIMEQSKRPIESIWIVLAKLMNTGSPEQSGEVIVGEYTEMQEE
jgi:hypothetical protein